MKTNTALKTKHSEARGGNNRAWKCFIQPGKVKTFMLTKKAI